MPTQNLVSAQLTSVDRDAVLAKIAEIRRTLNFLIHLTPEEVRGLFKAGNGFLPVVEKAYAVSEEHPEILPRAFDREEYRRDVELLHALRPVQQSLAQLCDAVNDTMTAVSSDALCASMEIYGAMKLSSGKVPGMDVLQDDISSYFRRSRRSPATST
jgi:hypothetical protein